METKISKILTQKRIMSLIMALIMIINMFSPYGILISNSYAAEEKPQPGEPYWKLKLQPLEEGSDAWDYYYYDLAEGEDPNTYTGTKYVFMDLSIEECTTVIGATIYLKYDKSKLIPKAEVNIGSNKRPQCVIQDPTSMDDWGGYWDVPAVDEINLEKGFIGYEGGTMKGNITPGEIIATLMFELAEGITIDDITKEDISLNAGYKPAYPTGLKIPYDRSTKDVQAAHYFQYEGFTENTTKTVTSITLDGNMDKTKYYKGEDIDFTGASLTITYDNGDTETITDINKAVIDGIITINETKASENKKVIVTAGEKTCEIPYNIVIEISVAQNPTKTDYTQGDTINLAGGKVTVTYDNGDTDEIDMTSTLLTSSPTTANVDNEIITLTYKDGTTKTTLAINVTDPVESIKIIQNPTNLEYRDKDPIDFSGGIIEVIKKSGKKETVQMTDSSVVKSANEADINSCPSTTTNPDTGLPAGNQTITVTYEGMTDNFNILVNDTITGIAVKTNPTAKNKYGTEGNALNLSGATLEISTTSGNKITEDINVGMLDLSSYNANTLTAQNIPVNYNGLTTSEGNGLNITLKDYITGITVTSANDVTTIYNNDLKQSDINGVTYVKNYASGATSTTPIPVTLNMISGYNKKPSITELGTTHEFTGSVTVTLNTADDADIDTIPVTDTFNVTVKDKITGITVSQRPNKTTYNYGDTFSATGGRINRSFASGAVESGNGVSMNDTNVKITETDGTEVNMSPSASEFTNGRAIKTLKVTYTDSEGTTYDTQLTNIIIKDIVTNIEIQNPPTVLKYGETLDLNGTTINIVGGSNNGKSIPVTNEMVSYDTTKIGEVTVTVTYGKDASGDDITDTFKITVKDYVTGITLNKTEVEGVKGTTLNKLISDNGLEYTVTYAKAGAQNAVTLTEDMVTGYSETAIQDQNLSIAYIDKDTDSFTKGTSFPATLTVKFQNTVTGITIKVPNKTKYNHGENLDLTGGIINLTYANGTTGTEPITADMIKETDGSEVNMNPATYDSSNKISKTLVITYEKDGVKETENYPIEIINDIKSITIHTTPKNKYNVNDDLDITSGEISVKRAVGIDEIISMENPNISVTGFKADQEYTQLALTVSYTENGITKDTEYKIDVVDTVTSITITSHPQTVKYGEELDLSKITIEAVKGSGTTHPEVTTNMISGFDKNEVKEQTVTITYGGKTDTFNVTVQDYVTGITVNPDTVTGTLNTTLRDLINQKSITYTVTYAKVGAQTPVTLTEDMVKGYSPTSTKAQNLTVTYTDNDLNSFTKGTSFPTTLNVTLVDAVIGVTVEGTPTKTNYNYAEQLDFTGIKIYEQHASDITGSKGTPVEITNATITDITEGETGAQSATTSLPANVFVSNKQVTRRIRVYYTSNGHDDHVDFDITVLNTLDHIEITTTPKNSYELNDSTENAGGIITIYRSADPTNSTETMNILDKMISGLDTSEVGQNFEATVTYEEKDAHGKTITKTDTYNYDVTDTVVSITLNPGPDKTDYRYGETLDLKGAFIEIVKANGTKQTIPVTENMVSGFNNTPNYETTTFPDTQVITVTYGKYADGTPATVTFQVTVDDFVSGILFVKPDKEKYNYGENLDLTGGTIQKIMASGKPTTIVKLEDGIKDGTVTISAFNSTQTGAQTITVEYEGETKTFTVEVVDEIKSMKIKDTPKQDYKFGEKLDVTGGTIEVTRTSGKTEIIPITPSMVTGYNPEQLEKQTLTVTYEGLKDTYDITVQNHIEKIEITKPEKLIYNIGEEIVLDQKATVIPIMADGTKLTPIPMTKDMISGFNTDSEGSKTITVTYEGKTATFSITVQDPLSSIKIKTLPDKLEYLYGENLNLTGATLEVKKLSGASEIVKITDSMVSGYDPKKLGEQKIKVTYEGTTQEFSVNVKDYISKLTVKAPNKVEYEYGEELDLQGGKVSIIMASGKVEENIVMTASMVSGFNKTQEGNQTIKVEYKGLQGSFQVKVIDKVKGITLKTEPDKTNYKYGENLDLTGATITVVKSSGTYTVKVTKEMVSGYNGKQAGTQVITINYSGFTTEFIVTVAQKTNPTKPTQPTKPDNTTTNTPGQSQMPEQPIIERPITEKPIETPKGEKPIQEKPTGVLGVKDEENKDNRNVIAGYIAGIGLLFILILIICKHNIKVYVFEDGEFVLGGKDKISKKKPSLNVDKFLDGGTYPNQVKIRLNNSISKKLDGVEIEITHRGQVIKHTVKYNNEKYEIILD